MTESGLGVEVQLSVLSALVEHASEALPGECCGLLVGTQTRIERSARARNLRASPTRYQVDPADHFRAIRSARTQGLVVMGAYHSHPNGALEPSPTDLAEASDPTLLYVIVAPGACDALVEQVAAFRLVGDRFERVVLAVGDSRLPSTT